MANRATTLCVALLLAGTALAAKPTEPDPALVDQYGITGPVARAAGVAKDVRTDQPYLVYDRLDFEPVTATASDADLPAQTLTFTLAGAVPAGAAITTGGVFTWTPEKARSSVR